MPLLLISDSNILIDIEVGGLTASMFSLEYDFAVPDILFADELAARHGHLIEMGLQSRTMEGQVIERAFALINQYRKPSKYDIMALALAEYENCCLLTGDKDLREAAVAETIEVRGTIWLVAEMVLQGRISVDVAEQAYVKMRKNGRRLPWDLVEQSLRELREIEDQNH